MTEVAADVAALITAANLLESQSRELAELRAELDEARKAGRLEVAKRAALILAVNQAIDARPWEADFAGQVLNKSIDPAASAMLARVTALEEVAKAVVAYSAFRVDWRDEGAYRADVEMHAALDKLRALDVKEKVST